MQQPPRSARDIQCRSSFLARPPPPAGDRPRAPQQRSVLRARPCHTMPAQVGRGWWLPEAAGLQLLAQPI
eukprot:scaffold65476_cov69-Phaeocystis_antarctica.AAC.2